MSVPRPLAHPPQLVIDRPLRRRRRADPNLANFHQPPPPAADTTDAAILITNNHPRRPTITARRSPPRRPLLSASCCLPRRAAGRNHFRPQGTPSTVGERIYPYTPAAPRPPGPPGVLDPVLQEDTRRHHRSRSSGLGSHARFPPLLLPTLRRTSSFLRPSSPVPCLPPARASSSLRIRSRDATLLCLTASTSLCRFCRALRRPPARPPARPGSSVLRVR